MSDQPASADSSTPPRVDVVIPCYNEAGVIRQSVETTLAFLGTRPEFDWRIVIADNGPSNDGTQQIALELEAEFPGRVKALLLDVKGRGLALREAWLGSEADVVAYMDADLSTDIRHLPKLASMITDSGCDIASGTRLSRHSKTTRSIKREITSRGYVGLIRVAFPRLRITDAQCGFKAMSRRAARELVPLVENRMWFFDTELLILAHRRGFRLCELPVRWVEDPDTKVNIIKTATEDLRGLLRMRFRRI